MISTSGAGPKPCFVNKVLLKHSRVQLVYILSVPATETLWPVKPQIIRKWSFSKDVCWSLLCLRLSTLQAVLEIRSKYTLMKGILSFQGRELREISPGFLSKVTMQRIVSSTAFLTDFLWFPALLLMMDNTYTCVWWRNFLEGEHNAMLVQSASLLWLNPKTRFRWIKGNNSDSLQSERIAYLLSARPYSTFHT